MMLKYSQLNSFQGFMIKFIFLFSLLHLNQQGNAQGLGKTIIEELENSIAQHMDATSPGVAIGIVRNGETIYESYSGYANLEHNIKVDHKTRFNIASNAKQYTALCILKLIEEETIGLEDDIRKYIPNLYVSYKGEITISDLITHTSGIRDVYDLWALRGDTWWKLFIDNDDAIKLLETQTDFNFEPGSEYLYSNSNYLLLAEIIKRVTGKPFSEYASTFFTDLGMTNTSFLTNYMKVIPQKARPYGNWGGWREYPSITGVHGDGGLFTTLSDQLKWEKIIQRTDNPYFSQSLMNKSQSIIPSSSTDEYGYGLMFGKYKDLNYTYHDGNTGAYNATFLRFTDENITIVVMSNNGSVPTNYLAKQLADIILELEVSNAETYQALPDKVEELNHIQDILGDYQHKDGTVISIYEKNDSIYRRIYQRNPLRLIPEKGGLFQYATIENLKMNFENIGTPEQKFTIYLSTQEPSTYHKVANPEFDKRELEGRFYNKETETEIIIAYVGGNNYTIIKNGKKKDAVLIFKDYLRMMSAYKIRATRDNQENVIGLNVENNRIRNVIFKKE